MGTKWLLMQRTLVACGVAASAVWIPTGGAASAATVRVRAGDTLSSLAVRLGSTVASLVAANHLSDPNRILAGQVLQVPGGPGDFELANYAVRAASGGSGWLPGPVRNDPSRRALVATFTTWANYYGVDPALLEALCWWESGWQSGVVSSTGAVGIGQLEPSTVTQMRRAIGNSGLSPWRPADNIRMSAKYLSLLIRQTGGNSSLALAGYYQGLASVRQRGMMASTRHYVAGIESYASLFRS